MSADVRTVPLSPAPERTRGRPPRAGWRVVAAKEFGDYLSNVRFWILLLILGLAAATTVYFAASAVRDIASNLSGGGTVFIAMFTVAPSDLSTSQPAQIPPFYGLVGFLLPLVGIAFGFDAINGERAQGTLPRLLAQPIHRDDVINGKFAAGLAVIATVLVAITGLIAAIGIVRLGITPGIDEVARLIAWLVVSIVYVGFWLAFATLCSVALRRAATSALVAIGLWLLVTIFATFLVSTIAGILAPGGSGSSIDDQVANANWTQFLSSLSPSTLYQQATVVLLNPTYQTVGVILPSQAQQLQTGGIPTILPFSQSLLLIWPQVVAIVGLTVACFAVAYVLFLRQEVRA
ncbi:MAG TPA: ABC transporter permease [Candidatus Limnocylindrales bacterium]|nr:ABC transporter permease [Candidatus Limnocylindrales bacterium]